MIFLADTPQKVFLLVLVRNSETLRITANPIFFLFTRELRTTLKIEGKTDRTVKVYKFICPIFRLDKTSLHIIK